MTSVELLRKAVTAIREDEPGRDAAERTFYQAVADWLAWAADRSWRDMPTSKNAITVARAYLGGDS